MSDPGQASTGFAQLQAQQVIFHENANFVPQLWHVDALILVGDASIQIAAHADIPLPVGCRIDLVASNATPFTVDDANVTVNSDGGKLSVSGQWVGASLNQTAVDVWLLTGGLA